MNAWVLFLPILKPSPPLFPVFGDCGAFDYITKDAPPFTTDEMLNYYSRLDFDYGVSLDHLILDSHDKPTRDFRYKLTIDNAKDFINALIGNNFGEKNETIH